MGDLFYQLGRGVAFRRIKHPHLPWITRRLPTAVTALAVLALALLPAKPTLFGGDGLNGFMITLVATLPGFFIAALAAVATFDGRNLDSTMPAPAPRLSLRTGNRKSDVELTMRMFLSHLFAYLAVYSFLLALLCIVAEALAPSVRILITNWQAYVAQLDLLMRLCYAALIAWFLSNIITAALFGMYFLAERIHRPNA